MICIVTLRLSFLPSSILAGAIKSPDASDVVRIISADTPCLTKKSLAARALSLATYVLASSVDLAITHYSP